MMSNKSIVRENILDKLNTEQKEAVQQPLNWCTKIVAGAGTGKTEIISRRFTKLVFDLIDEGVNNPASKILVITFTDKAATNMKDRIIKTLKKFDIDVINSDLWISTFHSFCSKVLKRHSLEACLSPECNLADEPTQNSIYENIIKKLMYNEYKTISNVNNIASQLGLSEDILSINNIQNLNKINDPGVVFEDIYVIIKKIKSLGLTPQEFMDKSITATHNFTEKVGTIPFKYSDKEGYMMAWELHLKEYMEISSGLDDKSFNEICKTKLILDKNGARNASSWGYASGYPDNLAPIEELEIYLIKLIAVIYAIYQNQLVEQDLTDYDDQINYTINLLKNNEELLKYYQNQFKHIIIDEFQDTSGSQLELVKLLLNPEEPDITFVGDRKQSIYAFRYAQMENLEVLHQHIEDLYKKDYKEIKLKTNYRSTQHVLEPVNILTKSFLNLDEELFADPEKPVDQTNKNVSLSKIFYSSKINEGRISEAKYIACEIARLKEENNELKYKDFAVLVPKHSRAEIIEKYLQEAGIPSVKKQNLNFFKEPVVKNLLSLLMMACNLRDEVAFIRLLEIRLNHQELYLLKKELYKLIPEEDAFIYNTNFVDKIIYLSENNLIEKLNIPSENLIYIKKLLNTLLEISSNIHKLSLPQLFYSLTSNIPVYHNLSEIEAYKAEENIKIFEKILIDYSQSDANAGLKGFIEAFNTYQQDKAFELPVLTTQEVDAVQIMTIHASKGLEFPYLFVTSLNSGKGKSSGSINFDLQYGKKPGFGLIINKYAGNDTPKKILYKELWQKPRELNENMRLFYVAISRAENYLNIINLIDPDKRTNVPDYTSEIISENQVNEYEPENIMYVKKNLEKFHISDKTEKHLLKEKMPELEESQSIIKLSFSQINTFKHCPAKYLLKYKFSFPEIKKESRATNTGSLLHTLVFHSFIKMKAFSKQEISQLISSHNPALEDIEIIYNLYESFKSTPYVPEKLAKNKIYTEKKFTFTENIENIKVEFNGDIDLVIKNADESYTVIDFKTNKQVEKSLEDYYQQLLIYKKGLTFEGLKVKDLKIVNLIENDYKEFNITQEMLDEADKNLREVIWSIVKTNETGIIPSVKDKQNCHSCGFRYLCKS